MAQTPRGFEPPVNPLSIAERPLTGGIIRHLASNMMPPGSVLDARNVRITQRGIERRDGVYPLSDGQVLYGPVQDIIIYWTTTGLQQTLAIDQKFLYLVTTGGVTPIYDSYATGTVSVSGSTVIGDSVGDWTVEDVRPGDILALNPDTEEETRYAIANVGAAEMLTIEGTATATDVPYAVRRAFATAAPFTVDYTNNGMHLLFVDGARPIRAYDGDTFGDYGQSGDYIPNVITYYNDRIFIGRTQEGGAVQRQRIRWSGIGFAQHADFPAGNFIDLPYTTGELLRLLPFGGMLIAYFSDAIFVGQPTNNPNLPVQFQQLETGGIGLVGMKAVAKWHDGHYFVGQDDIYFFSNRGVERIGTPIVDISIERASVLSKTYVATDPSNTRFVCAMAVGSEHLNRIFSFDYISQAWSYFDMDIESLSSIGLLQTITWGDLTAEGVLTHDSWDQGFTNYPTWESLGSSEIPPISLYFGRQGQIWQQLRNTNSDDGAAIPVRIITRDEDYDSVDKDKLWLKFTLKVEEPVSTNVDFILEASVNRGRTWKALGTLRIPEGYDEGKADFRVTGQLARFRLRSTTLVEPYTIVEFTRRVAGQGVEVPSRGPSA